MSNWEFIGAMVIGKGQLASLSRFYELYTNLFGKKWPKQKTGKLKKSLNISYNGVALQMSKEFVYYTVDGGPDPVLCTDEEKLKNLFKWGETLSYEQIQDAYKLVYSETLEICESEMEKYFIPSKKKWFTGAQLIVPKVPLKYDVDREIEELKVKMSNSSSEINAHLKSSQNVIMPKIDDLYDLDEDLYSIPIKRKKNTTENSSKHRKLGIAAVNRPPVQFSISLFDKMSKIN